MRPRDATEMLADSGVKALGPTIWADLGCGDGTFTLALAEVLASGSTIHAMDLDASALREDPFGAPGRTESQRTGEISQHSRGHSPVSMAFSWPTRCTTSKIRRRSFDVRTSNEIAAPVSPRRIRYEPPSRWLPYPVSQTSLAELFERAGYSSIKVLRSRPSVYRRAPLYAAAIGLMTGSRGDAPLIL